jgi:hypothetical protein
VPLNVVPAVLVAFALLWIVPITASEAVGGAPPTPPVQWTAGIGFDSFGERYSIEEADTLAFSNEVWTRAGLHLQRPWSRRGRVWVEDLLSFSNLALRNRLALGGDFSFRQDDALSFRSDLALRRNHPKSDPDDALAVSSSYWQEDARISYRPRLGDQLRLRLGERFFAIDFEDESRYEYDYFQNELLAAVELERGPGRVLDLDYGYARRTVPDSSAIDYGEQRLRASFRATDGLWGRFELMGEAARRHYRVEEVRPGSTVIRAEGALVFAAGERFEVRLGDGLESTTYDAPSNVYFDLIENRAGLGVFFLPGPAIEVGGEPRYTRFRADEGGEDFDELSLVLALRIFRGRQGWFDLAIEPGHRDYLAGGPESIYSDYDFVRGTLLGSLALGDRTSLDTYLSYEPERHEEPGDDAAITLISADLTVRF